MPPEALRPETPSGFSGRSESVDGRLLQERLRLFSGIAFLISAAFYGVGRVLAWLGRENPPTLAGHVALVAILLLMGGTWLYCRSGPRAERTLRAVEVLLMLVLCTLVLVVPTGSIPEPELRGMVMLLSVNLVLYTRAIFIPSSARRTLAVSVVTALPLAIYSLANETVRLSVWKVVWLLAAITIATAGSAVIYGLRREVRHARQLGQYTLEEKLGEGGMGVVYRARHAMLRRPTAVKLLKPERMGEAGLRRFEREVQLTAGLSHPNTVTVFDYGRTPDGVFYYAMEYLEGLGLDQLVAADGPQPPGRVVHIYSVGAVAYFLLTGRHVFEGRTIIEICGHHLHTPPTPPSERLGRPLPAALEAWVLACLEKDPARRPASASEAAARLELCVLAGEWTPDEARAWWVAKGRHLAATRRAETTPSGATLSRPVIERAG